MTDQEYNERLGAIEEMALRFPGAELTEQNIKGYVWSLSDLSQITLRAAIEKCVASSKFFPSVAEIRENAEAVRVSKDSERHPDSCACFGSGMIQFKDNGYNQVRRCDSVASEVDPVDTW